MRVTESRKTDSHPFYFLLLTGNADSTFRGPHEYSRTGEKYIHG